MLAVSNGIMDFSSLRARMEYEARVKHKDSTGNMEVTLSDIWSELESRVGVSALEGMALEQKVEESICFANPFMKSVWDQLIAKGARIVITSDMYLPQDCIERILHKNGYEGYEKLYLSNVYQKSKAEGDLYQELLKDYPGYRILHIGDNEHSDVKMAKAAGLSTMYYQNVNKNTLLYRAYDMSTMIGSAYRGIVSTYLYNGLNKYSMEYEYGFIYGGLFVLGYCGFIHDYVLKNGVDKVLFLSRDGDILKKVYEYLYPNDNVSYAYWSRKAATKLEAYYNKEDYFRRFIDHKCNQKYKIESILRSMELEFLVDGLDKLKVTDELTTNNSDLLKEYIESNWDKVNEFYSNQMQATRSYYTKLIGDSKKVVAVDIGWAGSGARALRHLIRNEWKMDCDLVGIIAGTNTIHNAEPDASEAFLQSGQLVSYMYSQSHNRDLLKKHDPNKDYNVFWELLLSSPTPRFRGFYSGDFRRNESADVYDSDLDITLQFGECDYNSDGIVEIQKGIMDFAREYQSHWGDLVDGEFSYMYNISGRDAYAPMLVAASHNEKYLKVIAKKFSLEKNVV